MSVGDERLVDDVRVANVAAGVPGLHKVIWDVVRFTVLQLRGSYLDFFRCDRDV